VLLKRCKLAGEFAILRDFVPHDVVGGAYHRLCVHDVDVAPLRADVEPCAVSGWQGAARDSVGGGGKWGRCRLKRVDRFWSMGDKAALD
jgi:hypothetical protein